VLYHVPLSQEGEYTLNFGPEAREHIVWYKPLEELFEMSKLLKDRELKTAVQVQNAILLSVAKMVLYFPGLIEVGPDTKDRLAGSVAPINRFLSQRPFDDFDDDYSIPTSPWEDTIHVLDFLPGNGSGGSRCQPPNPKKVAMKLKKRRRDDLSDEDSDSDSNSESGLDNDIAKSSQT
jgi:hypothetical protein